MEGGIFQLGAVTASLIFLYILPWIPIASALYQEEDWPAIVLISLVVGCTLQAVLGLLWTHLVGAQPYGEVVVLSGFWIFLLSWSWARVKKANKGIFPQFFKQYHLIVFFILLTAFWVRSIHPLQVAYLGQSDAYTHLNYLHNIVDQGRLVNPVYPPGFHWILAFPVLVFSLDPYWIARYGGAFFAVGLVLGIFVFLDRFFTRRAAIFGSFCAACFPPMILLMKTGVGVFANQFGLFLLPVIFYLYVICVSPGTRKTKSGSLLLFTLCGLSSTVPMLVLHVFLVMSLERFVSLISRETPWLRDTFRVFCIVIPATCLLLFHVTQVGPGQRFQTANILMDAGAGKQPLVEKVTNKIKFEAVKYDSVKQKVAVFIAESPYFRLLLDYLSLKRKGFGNDLLDGLGWTLFAIFIGFIVYGIAVNRVGFLVLGLWGWVTCMQAATGFLQFSSYQREGWSLLIAVCCMSGIFASIIFHLVRNSRIVEVGVGVGMLSVFTYACLHPPQHQAISSSAENEIVRVTRFLGQYNGHRSQVCQDKKSALCILENELDRNLPLVIVTRPLVGWRNQGEIIANILPASSNIKSIAVGNRFKAPLFQPGKQYVVFVDRYKKMDPGQIVTAFAMVARDQVEATMKNIRHLYTGNSLLLESVNDLDKQKWVVKSVLFPDDLTVYVVKPKHDESFKGYNNG